MPKLYFTSSIFLLLLQAAAYAALGAIAVEKLYPFLVHIPLICILHFISQHNWTISIANVVLAYLLCTPRLWFGTLIAIFFHNNTTVSYMVQCLVTIPLLWFITRFLTPYIHNLEQQDPKVLRAFISLPTWYYIFDFWLTIYSDWYYTKAMVLLRFMDVALVLIYTAFLFFFLKILQEKQEVEVLYNISEMMSKQSQIELDNLRIIQEKDAIYRHDLRHHLSYLKTSILANNTSDTLQYIEQISKQLDEVVVQKYCENENINLILSSYISQAKAANITPDIAITASDFSSFSSIDLCSLLANALENAIHANDEIIDISRKYLSLRIFVKGNYLCLDIRNIYNTPIVFQSGIPCASQAHHGYGVKSIVNIVKKYNGTHSFHIKKDIFVFQTMLQM